jgi:acetolactate synthase small subunit
MFSIPSWGFSTSYFYRSSLLANNNILFDTSFVMAEDYYFVLECMVKAHSICYLNQLIGYTYLQNDQSIIQTVVKPAETVMRIVENYKKLLSLMDCYAINDSIVLRHLCLVSNYVLSSPDLTYKQRQKIKTILERFIVNVNTDTIKNSIYSETEIRNFTETIYDIILSPENTIEVLTVKDINGEKELASILLENKDTDIGKKNGFMYIKTMDSYRFRMVMTDKAFIKPLIDLQIRVGETGLLTQDVPIRYFELPDGTLLPCTAQHIKPYNEAVASILNDHHNLFIAQSVSVDRVTNDGAEVDSLDSALVKDYFAQNYMKRGIQCSKFMAPVEVFFAQSHQDELDYHSLALYALADANIDQIVAFNTCHVVHFFNFIEENWQQLLEEVHCCIERKEELATIFNQGFSQPIANKLWSKLQRVVAYGAGELYEYTAGMKQYTGTLPHNHGYYFTEETIFGKAVENDSNLFECLRKINYYELLPMVSLSDNTCRWTDVNIEEPYTLVVTNHAGLYRFITDHIICPKEVTKDHIYYTIY